MKQTITLEQLHSLDSQSNFLYEKYCLQINKQPSSLLTIGEMIQFLDEQSDYSITKTFVGGSNNRYWAIREVGSKMARYYHKELADTLFSAVREVLYKQSI